MFSYWRKTAIQLANVNGDVAVVQFLLAHNNNDINARDDQGRSALHVAISSDSAAIVQYLVDNGADITARYEHNRTVLHLASNCSNMSVVQYLLEHGVDVYGKDERDKTALHLAKDMRNVAFIDCFLQHCFNNNLCDEDGHTALDLASRFGNECIVRWMLEHGSDINARNKHGQTALHTACYYVHAEIIPCLLEHGADIDARDKFGCTALHIAVNNTYADVEKVINQLLKKQPSMSICNNRRQTPLQLVALKQDAPLVDRFLLQPGLTKENVVQAHELLSVSLALLDDVSPCYDRMFLALRLRYEDQTNIIEKPVQAVTDVIGNRKECRSLDELYAIRNSTSEVQIQALLMRKRLCPFDRRELLIHALFLCQDLMDADHFDAAIAVWVFITQDAELTWVGEVSLTQQTYDLHYLIRHGAPVQLEAVAKALERILDIISQGLSSQSTAAFIDEDCLEGCVVNALNVLGLLIALHTDSHAEKHRIGELAYRLVRMKLRVIRQRTPLHLACSYQTCLRDVFGYACGEVVWFPNTRVVQMLLHAGADPNDVDVDNQTPLHLICRVTPSAAKCDIIQALLQAGAHLDQRNCFKQTASELLLSAGEPASLIPQQLLPLQCLAATAVAAIGAYNDLQLPAHLEELVKKH